MFGSFLKQLGKDLFKNKGMQEEIKKEETGDVVSLDLVKKHLRIEPDYTDDDELIKLYIESAIDQVVNFTERPLTQQTTVYTTNKFEDFVFERKALNDAIEKIEYRATAEGESSVLPGTSYSVVQQGTETFKVSFKEKPAAVSVQIFIKQGYTSTDLPKVIKQAILLLVTEAYDRRDNNAAVINSKAKNLLQPYRKWRV